MSFEFAVHPTVLDNINGLPALMRARLTKKLSLAMSYGLTIIEPGHIEWEDENRFSLFVPSNPAAHKIENGVMIHGFVEDPFEDTFYIGDMFHFREGKCLYTDKKDYQLRHQQTADRTNLNDYIILNKEWIEAASDNPFVQKASQNVFSNTQLDTTLPEEIEHNFYKSLKQIKYIKKNKAKFASDMPYLYEAALKSVHHRKFDTSYKNQIKREDLKACIESFKKYPKTLLIVNFIDETDLYYNAAQLEYMYMMAYYLRHSFPKIKLQIIDVTIKDLQGNKPYYEDFLHYHESRLLPCKDKTPAPFTMIMGGVTPRENELFIFPDREDRRLLDIDLFAGCRKNGDPTDEDNSKYVHNLRYNSHKLLSLASTFTDNTTFWVKNLKGRSKFDALSTAVRLHKKTAIIRVTGKEGGPAIKTAEKACVHAILSGHPYVTMVVHDQFYDDIHPESVTICKLYGKDRDSYIYEGKEIEENFYSILGHLLGSYYDIPLLSDFGIKSTMEQRYTIPKKHIDRIQQLKKETGVSIPHLFKELDYMVVNGLNPRKVDSWLKGKTKTAFRHDVLWVIEAYEFIKDENHSFRKDALFTENSSSH